MTRSEYLELASENQDTTKALESNEDNFYLEKKFEEIMHNHSAVGS